MSVKKNKSQENYSLNQVTVIQQKSNFVNIKMTKLFMFVFWIFLIERSYLFLSTVQYLVFIL